MITDWEEPVCYCKDLYIAEEHAFYYIKRCSKCGKIYTVFKTEVEDLKAHTNNPLYVQLEEKGGN